MRWADTSRQKCYESLIENLDLSDSECIKYSISKALGVAIVLGGSIMKVPQLLLSMRFLPFLHVQQC